MRPVHHIVRPVAAILLVAALAACGSRPLPSASSLPTAVATPPGSSDQASPPSDNPPARDGARYLAVGDSVTYGIGAPHPARQGFPARVVRDLRALPDPVTDVTVLAIPGVTAAGFAEGWLDDALQVIGSSAEPVRLVTVGLGANEVLRTRRDGACIGDRTSVECRARVAAAIDQAAAALDEIVGRLQEAAALSGGARILLLAYYNPDPDPLAAEIIAGSDGRVGCDAGEARQGLDDRIACVADAHEVQIVDLYAAFVGREHQLTRIDVGDVHPTVRGYRVIADEIVEAYESLD